MMANVREWQALAEIERDKPRTTGGLIKHQPRALRPTPSCYRLLITGG
jgi:hypothetical protein